MTTPIRAVLFDAGNTLIYVDPARMTEVLARAGAAVDVAAVARVEHTARRILHDGIAQGHRGTEPELWKAYFVAIFQGGGVPSDRMEEAGRYLGELHASNHMWTHVEPGTVEALEALAGAGYRLGVISNADGRVEAVLEDVGLRSHFEFVIDSEVVGVEKPDPAIFEEGCRRMDLPPEACLYVGDLYPVDYVGATGAGLQAVLIDPLGLHDGRAPRVTSLGELPGYLARQGG